MPPSSSEAVGGSSAGFCLIAHHTRMISAINGILIANINHKNPHVTAAILPLETRISTANGGPRSGD
jgi:hypothetical protein